MDIEKLYQNEIDFKSFENEIQLWGMKYPSICNIIFYSGMRDRRYIILFEINKSLESVFLTDDYRAAPISNFLEKKDGKDMLIKAKSLDYSLDKSFLDNWYIFSKDINSEHFSLCDPLFREKYASDDLPLEVYTKLSREDKIKMTEPLKRFISHEKGMPESGPIWFLDYSKNSKDFVGDKSWTLSKKGFQKFIIPEHSKVLYQRDDVNKDETISFKKDDLDLPIENQIEDPPTVEQEKQQGRINEEAFPKINFPSLKMLAAKWAKECFPYINEISFYTTTNKSYRKYLIDIVVNDPPKIEPEFGYVGAGRADYFLELSEVRIPQTENSDDIRFWGDLWDIDARWQTSEPNPYIVEESKVNLYEMKESFKHSFPDLRIDKLKNMAQNWVLDYKKTGVVFRTITLFRYRASVHTKRYANKKYTIDPDDPAKIPTKYAIIFDLMDYEWKNLPPEEWHKIIDPYHDFIYNDTHFMNANSQFSSSLLTDFDEIYKIQPATGYRKEWVLLPRCKNLYQTLPENIIIEQGFIFLYDSTVKETSNDSDNNFNQLQGTQENCKENSTVTQEDVRNIYNNLQKNYNTKIEQNYYTTNNIFEQPAQQGKSTAQPESTNVGKNEGITKTESKAATENQHFEDVGNDPLVAEKESSSLLPCYPGTEWKDITITLTSKNTVTIKTPQGEESYNCALLGMAYKQDAEKKKRVWTLLMLFATNKGIIGSDIIKENKAIFGNPAKHTVDELYVKFMSATKELNRHLKDKFGIDDSIYIGRYNKMWKDESALQIYYPKLFVPIEPVNGEKDLERQQTIWGLLVKKGYATKLTFASKLDYSPDPSKEKSLHDHAVEGSERTRMSNKSRKYTSKNEY